jgi:hypothetical protein
MNIGIWLLLAVISWLFGFFSMWYLEPGPKDKLAYVPKWLFILFGMPKHKKVPNTVQPILGIYLQSMGLTLAVYGVFLDKRILHDPDLSGLLGFGLSMVIGVLTSRLLYKRQPYSWPNATSNEIS